MSTRIYSLVFDYNLSKMKETGRPWAEKAYKNRDFIFEYSAASIATFLDKNPHLKYEILTDDVNLLSCKLDKYRVSTSNLCIQDASNLISGWTSHWYCFWPLIQSFDYFASSGDSILKLDNDLTCLRSIDDLLEFDGAIVWKKERVCADGKDYWGEKFAASRSFGTDRFLIYNTGTWGITSKWIRNAREIPSLCEKMIGVDISSVSRFPESPGLISSVFNTSDQTSNCFFLEKHKIPIIESFPWFDHHCYGHEAKNKCIEMASYLALRG
jgi:hypothetical protein